MSDSPTVLVPHTVSPDSADAFAAEVEDRLPGGALVRATTPAGTREHLSEAAVLVAFRPPAGVPEDAPNLAWIQALSSGVNHYDREALSEAGVALTNAGGVHAQPIAEQALGYLLSSGASTRPRGTSAAASGSASRGANSARRRWG